MGLNPSLNISINSPLTAEYITILSDIDITNNKSSKEVEAGLLTLIDKILSKPTLAIFTLIYRVHAQKKNGDHRRPTPNHGTTPPAPAKKRNHRLPNHKIYDRSRGSFSQHA
jgi:hypothetical protein